jgi:hypothetical protein
VTAGAAIFEIPCMEKLAKKSIFLIFNHFGYLKMFSFVVFYYQLGIPQN